MVNYRDNASVRHVVHDTLKVRFSAETNSSGSDEQLVATGDTFSFAVSDDGNVRLYWRDMWHEIEYISDLPYCDRVLSNAGEIHVTRPNKKLYKAWSQFLIQNPIGMEEGNFNCADALRAGREPVARVKTDRLCPFVFYEEYGLKGYVSFNKELKCESEKRHVTIFNINSSGDTITGFDDKTVVYIGGDHKVGRHDLTAAEDEIYRTTTKCAIFNDPESGFDMRIGSGNAVLFTKASTGVWLSRVVNSSYFGVLGESGPRGMIGSLGEGTRWEAVYTINRVRVSRSEAHAAGMELADNYLLFPEVEEDGSRPNIETLRRADAHGVTITKLRRNSPVLGFVGRSERRFFKAVKLLEILGSGPKPLLSAVAAKAGLTNDELHALMYDSDLVSAAVDSRKCFTLDTSEGWIQNDVLAAIGPWMDGRIVTLSSGGLYHTRKREYLQTEVRGAVAYVSVTKELVSTGLGGATFMG